MLISPQISKKINLDEVQVSQVKSLLDYAMSVSLTDSFHLIAV
jgi:hypothetical protein